MRNQLLLIGILLLTGGYVYGEENLGEYCRSVYKNLAEDIKPFSKHIGEEMSFQFSRYEKRNDGSLLITPSGQVGFQILIINVSEFEEYKYKAGMVWYTAAGTIQAIDESAKIITIDPVKRFCTSAR